MNEPLKQRPTLVKAKVLIQNIPRTFNLETADSYLSTYLPASCKHDIKKITPNHYNLLNVSLVLTMTQGQFEEFKKKNVEGKESGDSRDVNFDVIGVSEIQEEGKRLLQSMSNEEKIAEEEKLQKKERKQIKSRNSKILFFIFLIAMVEMGDITLNALLGGEKSDFYYRFIIKNVVYRANMSVRRPVNNENNTLVPPLKYVRDTYTEVLTYPINEWIEDEKKMLNFEKFKDVTGRDRERMENFLSLLQEVDEGGDAWALLFFNLYKYIQSQKYAEAEYYFLNKTFNLDKARPEIPMCLVSTGRNFLTHNSFHEYFKSMNLQNYTNFKIVYIDDASTDNSTEEVYAYVHRNYPRLRSKLTFVRNRKHVGAFMNKDSGIKENCGFADVVIDIDGDDALIGKQALNVLNAIYSDEPNLWLVYSNYLKVLEPSKKPIKGICRNLKIPPEDYRRNGRNWHTSHLKTYYMKLESKVPFDHLSEDHINPDGTTVKKYSRHASDTIMMFGMLELAGLERVRHIPHLLYYYRVTEDTYEWCHRVHQLFDEMKGRNMPPLQPLQNLDDHPKLIVNYPHEVHIGDYRSAHQTCVEG